MKRDTARRPKNWKAKLKSWLFRKPRPQTAQADGGMLARVKARVLAERAAATEADKGSEFLRLASLFGSLGKARRYQNAMLRRRARRQRRAAVRALRVEVGQIPPDPEPLRLRDRVRRRHGNGTLKAPGRLRREARKRKRLRVRGARRANR